MSNYVVPPYEVCIFARNEIEQIPQRRRQGPEHSDGAGETPRPEAQGVTAQPP